MDHSAAVSDEESYFCNIMHDGMFEHRVELDFSVLENILSDDEDNKKVEVDRAENVLNL